MQSPGFSGALFFIPFDSKAQGVPTERDYYMNVLLPTMCSAGTRGTSGLTIAGTVNMVNQQLAKYCETNNFLSCFLLIRKAQGVPTERKNDMHWIFYPQSVPLEHAYTTLTLPGWANAPHRGEMWVE